jgi:hypothetical protein
MGRMDSVNEEFYPPLPEPSITGSRNISFRKLLTVLAYPKITMGA